MKVQMPESIGENGFCDKQIAFLTTAIGTRWIFYQQYLLRRHFPGARRIIINGNVRWDFTKGLDCVWYDFVKQAVSFPDDVKYFIHIDEDCFITNPPAIYELISKMERDGISLMGPSEVIERVRGENPMALNSFFMLGKISDLKTVFSRYEIGLKFADLHIPLSPIEKIKVEYEPYYVFFWNYYLRGFKISFLPTGFHHEYHCTTLLGDSHSFWALHMWNTRHWSSSRDFCGLSNRVRYLMVRNYLVKKFDLTPFKLLASISIKDTVKILFGRFFSKNFYRMARRVARLTGQLFN